VVAVPRRSLSVRAGFVAEFRAIFPVLIPS